VTGGPKLNWIPWPQIYTLITEHLHSCGSALRSAVPAIISLVPFCSNASLFNSSNINLSSLICCLWNDFSSPLDTTIANEFCNVNRLVNKGCNLMPISYRQTKSPVFRCGNLATVATVQRMSLFRESVRCTHFCCKCSWCFISSDCFVNLYSNSL